MTTIVIVDDHPVVRDGLSLVLGDQPGFRIAGTAGTAEAAVDLARRHRPAVILLDLELPGLDGVSATPRLLAVSPASRILIFTAYESDERVFGAIRAGAAGYLLKGAPSEEIIRAVQTVAAGGSYLEPRIAARLVAELAGTGPGSGRLTPREMGVLRLLAAGLGNREIGRHLAISERTVKFHITSLLRKLDATNRTQAVSLALERGLLPAGLPIAPPVRSDS